MRTVASATAVGLLFMTAGQLSGQRVLLGGGVTAGTVPRALEPLCNSARRLKGVGITARAGIAAGAFRAFANVDYIGRLGVRDAADCVPRTGVVVDSAFAPAENSVTNLSISGWTPVYGIVQVGAETGFVIDHSSWFLGPALGVEARHVRFEVTARWHVTKFDEIIRDYGTGTVRELGRESRSEGSWGAAARLLLMTH